MNPDIPVPTEADYLDAALAASKADTVMVNYTPEMVADFAADATLRAAVDSAYAAGWRAGHVAGYDQGRDDGEGGAYTAYAHPGQATDARTEEQG